MAKSQIYMATVTSPGPAALLQQICERHARHLVKMTYICIGPWRANGGGCDGTCRCRTYCMLINDGVSPIRFWTVFRRLSRIVFLGGSASQVRDFIVDGIPFLALLNLLSSASSLVDVSDSGYISPEGLRATSVCVVDRHD